MFYSCTSSCARADDAKIARSRNAQCNTKEFNTSRETYVNFFFVP